MSATMANGKFLTLKGESSIKNSCSSLNSAFQNLLKEPANFTFKHRVNSEITDLFHLLTRLENRNGSSLLIKTNPTEYSFTSANGEEKVSLVFSLSENSLALVNGKPDLEPTSLYADITRKVLQFAKSLI